MKKIILNHIPVVIALLNTVMCFENLTVSVFLAALGLIALGLLVRAKLPWFLLFLLNAASIALVLFEYKTIFDIEAGASWLILLQNLKLLELKKKRDRFTYYMVAMIASISQSLFALSIIGTLVYFITTGLILFGIYKLNNRKTEIAFRFANIVPAIKFSSVIVPVIIIVYLVFPRFELGFSFFKKSMGRSGFSPSIDLENTGEISLSDRLVFKAFFEKKRPVTSGRYWIGNILSVTDGNKWSNRRPFLIEGELEDKNIAVQGYEYSVSLLNLSSRYLFILDRPVKNLIIGAFYEKTSSKSFRLVRTHLNKLSYKVITRSSGITVKNVNFREYLQVPKKLSQNILELRDRLKDNLWRKSVFNLDNYFKSEGFTYTLTPPASNTVDKFIENKQGFCVHFASAYGLLARLLNIPSRVVIGFQGGEENPFDGVMSIREKDAHAWVEIFDRDQGRWERVDPVSFVAPGRIIRGLSRYQNNQRDAGNFRSLYGLVFNSEIANYFRYLDNRWQSFIISFDTGFQEDLAGLMGIKLRTLYKLSVIIPLVFLAFAMLYFYFGSLKRIDPVLKAFKKFQQTIKDEELKKPPHEGYQEYFLRIGKNIDNSGAKETADFMCSYLYSGQSTGKEKIEAMIQKIKTLKVHCGESPDSR